MESVFLPAQFLIQQRLQEEHVTQPNTILHQAAKQVVALEPDHKIPWKNTKTNRKR